MKAYYVGDVLNFTPLKVGDKKVFLPEYDALIKEITGNLSSETWQSEGGRGRIRAFESNLTLIISQSPDLHEKVSHYLARRRGKPQTGRVPRPFP